MIVVAGRKGRKGFQRKRKGVSGAERGCLGPLDRWDNNASGMTRGWFWTVCLSIRVDSGAGIQVVGFHVGPGDRKALK
ncbi:hypothetical protein V6N13_147072 [Hibiscus sabdariffa]